jgi:hypothetical protein
MVIRRNNNECRLDCGSCGDSLCDCGDSWNNCVHCGRVICNSCLVKPYESDEEGEMSKECCPYCSGVEVHNDDLLRWLLDHYNLTKEFAEQVYKESNGGR